MQCCHLVFTSARAQNILVNMCLIYSTFDSLAGTCCIAAHTKFHGSLVTVVPVKCPMDLNKLNFVRHVAGTKYTPNKNWCCTNKKRGDMSLQHIPETCSCNIFMYANAVILSLVHAYLRYTSLLNVPATCGLSVHYTSFVSLLLVAATCSCNMSLQHVLSCLATFTLFLFHK